MHEFENNKKMKSYVKTDSRFGIYAKNYIENISSMLLHRQYGPDSVLVLNRMMT